MAKEAQEAETEENQEGEVNVQQPMFSKAGLIVFIVTVVLMIGGFSTFIVLIGKPKDLSPDLKPKKAAKTVADLNAPRIPIEKPIIISIPTNELATEFRHLAITLTIIIGRTQDENDPDFDINKTLAKEQFLETAEKFKPYVEDSVNRIALSYTYLELQDETTRKNFTRRLREDLNLRLAEYGLKKRITEILLTSFIFSD